jgi:choline dehydrogenase-like flavoprotein
MPRWQNLENPHQEKFANGYSVYPWGGCMEYPWNAVYFEGFGSSYKREVKRRYPTAVSFSIQAPSLPSPTNFLDLDPEVKDRYGMPVARLHFKWDDNALQMFEHSKQACAELLQAAGAVYEGSGKEPNMPGWSLHETGTCRMGNDPKHFVTNRFGQTHDVKNLYVCDASVFPSSTDKTTTISIMAFTLRTCDHMLENFKNGVHRRV